MNEIRRILCPCDFSEFSRRSLEYAMALARGRDAEITMLHVYVPALLPTGEVPYLSGRTLLEPVSRERVIEELAGFAEPARAAGIRLRIDVAEGDPVVEILKKAETMPADLAVMGTHGRGGFERWVLGSVTEKVLRKSCCPVLTIPRGARPPAGEERAALKRILCPIDFSEASLRALDHAVSFAREARGRLMLLHVLEAYPEKVHQEHLFFNLPAYRSDLEREARERFREALPPPARQGCVVEETVVVGKAYSEVLRAAVERKADLVVMGVQGRGALERMLFGSTTHHVVREAPCPVLTIRRAC